MLTDTRLPALDSYRRIRELLESGLRPDAFVAFSDIVATGISMALADTGKRVPEDVQVVSYDGIDNDRYHALTTIRQDIDLAILATELIMEAIRREPRVVSWMCYYGGADHPCSPDEKRELCKRFTVFLQIP